MNSKITARTPHPNRARSRPRAPSIGVLLAALLMLLTPGITEAQFVVNVGFDAPDADLTDGVADADLASPGLQTTLRAAVQELNLLPIGPIYTITFTHNAHLLTWMGPPEDLALFGDLDIRNNVIIRGNGIGVTIIDGTVSLDRLFHIPVIVDVTFADLSLVSTSVPMHGAAIRANAGKLTLRRVEMRDNATTAAGQHGGGIHTDVDTLIEDSILTNNAAAARGGAIYSTAHLELINTSLTDNTAADGGGATFSTASMAVTSCEFARNQTASRGGACWLSGAATTASIRRSRFISNRAVTFGTGGAISTNGQLTVTECQLIDNFAIGAGGAIDNRGTLNLIRSELTDNISETAGGGVATSALGTATARGNFFHRNTCLFNGGGLSNAGQTSVDSCSFVENVAHGAAATISGGGAIYNIGTLDIINSTLAANHAPSGLGGGIHNPNGTIELSAGSIAFNNAVDGFNIYNGGGFFPSSFTLTHTMLFVPVPPSTSGPDPLISGGWNFDGDGTALLAGPCDFGGTPAMPLFPGISPPILITGITPVMEPFPGSPLLQAGSRAGIITPAGTLITVDQLGRHRPTTLPDIGALEIPCTADYNNDGIADILDLLDFLNDFSNAHPRADINGDGAVDIIDLLDFLNAFSSGCP